MEIHAIKGKDAMEYRIFSGSHNAYITESLTEDQLRIAYVLYILKQTFKDLLPGNTAYRLNFSLQKVVIKGDIVSLTKKTCEELAITFKQKDKWINVSIDPEQSENLKNNLEVQNRLFKELLEMLVKESK
jgi:hypothetical protein